MTIQEAQEIVRNLFKADDGKPFELTRGQAEIFIAIATKSHPRVHIQAATRYGKSETISMAVLWRASTFPEKWFVAAGNKDKASVIMGDVIKHIYDNEYTKARFIREKGETDESIRRYRNKSRINFKVGNGLLGEIFIIAAGESALGFGAPNGIEDESALISGKDHAMIMRMLGDHPSNFLCKVGNPWDEEHFIQSYEDPEYYKIIIDYKQGLQEGRYIEEYIEEMRRQPFFDVLYECKFPKSGMADEEGWVSLLTREEIKTAFVNYGDNYKGFGINKLGVDVAGGGRNWSVIVQRFTNYAKISHKSKDPDTMSLAEEVMTLQKSNNINPSDIATDSVGIGKGVFDILNRQIPGVRQMNAGNRPISDKAQSEYVNQRAEFYWAVRLWILQGGKLEENEDWFQLSKIKYRIKLEGTRGKMQIMPKETMLKKGIDSPDVADALMMTFAGSNLPRLDKNWKDYEE